MEEDIPSFDFRKYILAIRRRWWIVPLLAILFSAAGLVLPQQSSSRAEVELRESDSILVGSQMGEINLSIPRRSAAEESSKFATLKYRSDLARNMGGASVSVVASSPTHIKIVAFAKTSRLSLEVLNKVIRDIRASRLSATKKMVGGSSLFVESQKRSLEKRISMLDDLLKDDKLPTGEGFSLAIQRRSLADGLDRLNLRQLLLQQYEGDASAGADVVSLEEASDSSLGSSGVQNAAALALAGAAVGLAGLVIQAFFDGRIRSRNDIDSACGANAMFGIVDQYDENPTGLALSVRDFLQNKAGTVALIGIHNDGEKEESKVHINSTTEHFGVRLTTALTDPRWPADLRQEVVVRTSTNDDEQAFLVASNCDATLLVAFYGRTGAKTLRAATRLFSSRGIRLAGVVLADVPLSEFKAALR